MEIIIATQPVLMQQGNTTALQYSITLNYFLDILSWN